MKNRVDISICTKCFRLDIEWGLTDQQFETEFRRCRHCNSVVFMEYLKGTEVPDGCLFAVPGDGAEEWRLQ